MKKFILIDANSLIHRAFHALPPLLTKDGQLVNAVYGFATIFLKSLKDFKPNYVACCFDVSKDTFRRQEYELYKANRPEQPSELYEQMVLIKQLLEAFNIPVYEKKGYEADDVIGTISQILKTQHTDIKTIIVSGDLDVLQLVDKTTEVYTLKQGISETVIYDEQAVFERFGFEPKKLVDYKALRGDLSDNIPGVKGIGEKTALDLIQKFGSLDKIYAAVSKGKNDKIKPAVFLKLKEQKEQAYLSQHLAQILCSVPLEFNLTDCVVRDFDTEHVVKLFQAWNFTSLINKIPQAEKMLYAKQGTLFKNSTSESKESVATETSYQVKDGYHLVDDQKTFSAFLVELKKQTIFAIDTETDGLNPFKNNLLGISFSWVEKEGWYITTTALSADEKLTIELKNILADEKVKKIGHNIKFDLEVLEQAGFKLAGLYFDTMIASYLLNPGTRQHNLEDLSFVEFGYKMQPITALIGEKKSQQINLSAVDKVAVANYSCEDADLTWRLYFRLSEKLDDAVIEGVLQKIEMPLIPVLAAMEKRGIKIDIDFLQAMSANFSLRLKNLASKIYKLAGTEFNISSPLQLKTILFEKLKISTAGIGKIKTGISTAAAELDKLKGRHEIIDLIMDYRELAKLRNTYLDPLPILADENQRVHTSFNQTVTATGRLSSSEPNLQNIPIRTDLGREIRRAFVAADGYKILSADYSQIELRIVASLANDKKMLAAFKDNEDIHTATAAKILDLPIEKVTKEERRQAKAVNFGIVYGLGPRGLAEGTGISYEQAQEFIERYFEVYSGIKEYIENTIALAHELGYTETLFGRRRYLPEINAHHPQLRAQAERMAVNHPVQGTSADLIKLAMINIEQCFQTEFVAGEAKMLLQVHDELVFEIKDDLVVYASRLIKEAMENVYQLRAPIKVEIAVGKNWGEEK